jgi:glycerophosphoryl diester phosphodiesterase
MNPLLDPEARPIIAHRGASADVPENTLAAFSAAVDQGADALEFDVRSTRDGVPVVMHDPTLARTTDRDHAIAHLTLAELHTADAGARWQAPDGSWPWRGRGLTVPTLQEVLRAFPALPMLIEIKCREAQDAAARVILEEDAAPRCVVASFKPGALRAFRRPPFQVGADRTDVTALLCLTRLGLPAPRPRCRLYAVPWRYKNRLEVPKPRFIREARKHGCPVHVWTVDDLETARLLWDRGANGIITNRPGYLRGT